jgi:hypothetical protein
MGATIMAAVAVADIAVASVMEMIRRTFLTLPTASALAHKALRRMMDSDPGPPVIRDLDLIDVS